MCSYTVSEQHWDNYNTVSGQSRVTTLIILVQDGQGLPREYKSTRPDDVAKMAHKQAY